ncbi:peroxisomal acyl-coenzyme A oxidase 1-like [Liolophura sinensis]|uniref:peroxisomal acyl-coenzyme A oxidase 1-like n=1 Tax=Liolophura sinensis TaxID=3198878 RepID=UPI0031591FA7
MESASVADTGKMPSKTNPDLQKERDRASFDSLQMTYFLYDGPEKVRRRRFIQNLALSDHKIRQKKFTYLTRDEAYSESMRKAVYLQNRIKELNLTDPYEVAIFNYAATAHEGSPLGLHFSMFLQTLQGMGTKEQVNHWVPRSNRLEIIGTYAQTELGHGTFIRGLETTATFDPKTDEFVMNTPSLTSMKWWPGALGKTTNHAIVMAQVYTRGQHCGVYPIIVQIRSLQNHQPMPGVTVGDIGPKFGYAAIDNGFLKLDNVRVPRLNMLMKHAVVEKDGTFRKLAYDKLTYGSMMLIRSYIVYDMARSLQQACTIAIRYSAVRRQSKINPQEREPQVLDFQTQQSKLFPHLAKAYAFHLVATEMISLYTRISEDVAKGDLENLPKLHALSAGLKAFTSLVTSAGIEQCRMACGGHGYAQLSGLPKIYENITPAVTYEGEYTVMALQTARFLMKWCTKLQMGETLPNFIAYLGRKPNRQSSLNSALNEESLLDAFEYRAARLILASAQSIADLTKQGHSQAEAWNLSSVLLVDTAMAHCEAFIVKVFSQRLSERTLDAGVRRVLTTLYRLYCCSSINSHLGDYLVDGYLSADQAKLLKEREISLFADLRPDAVALVDALDMPDEILDSCIGRYDGNVYEAMYNYAKNSPLNKTEVHDSYYKYLRPLIQAGMAQSKL